MRTAICLLGVLMLADHAQSQPVELTIQPDRELNRVDVNVYGHFLEHIYHSVHGGLWGELIWNRSFEALPADAALWQREGDTLRQLALNTGRALTFGDPSWTDYELTLQARRDSGPEGFLILVRVAEAGDFYWVNFGGWANTRAGLECHVDSPNRSLIADAPNRIDADRWYRVRIRCEGNRIRAWLDGEPVLDATDAGQHHMRGAVGLAAWFTRASFRDVRVAALDGRTLYEGLPEVAPAETAAPEHWMTEGTGRIVPRREDALNGEFCLELTAAEGEVAGIRQEGLAIHEADTLRGAIWARGATTTSLRIRLSAEGRTVAESVSPTLGADWRRYPFTLRVDRPLPHAALHIELTGAGRAAIDQVELMPERWRAAGGFRPDLLAALRGLQPPLLRWPGGCYAERYRWKDGIGPQHTRGHFPIRMWDDIDPNALGTDEFIDLCRRLGAEPVLVINSGRHDNTASREDYVREALDWLEYCNGDADTPWGAIRAANGHAEPFDVRYWEIDNEAWPVGPEAYAGIVRDFATALRSADPDITLIACGSAGYDEAPGPSDGWNASILESCAEHFDILSVHHYENPDLFAAGADRYLAFLEGLAGRIRDSRNPNIRLFVSEWNAQSTDWRTGLYAAKMLNGFERLGAAVTMASPALLIRHVSATQWDNAFINHDARGWFPAPNYVVMRLWREHYLPVRLAVEGEAGPLDVVATRSGNGRALCVKCVNPGEHAVQLRLGLAGPLGGGRAVVHMLAPGDLHARNTLDSPNAIAPRTLPIAIDGGTMDVTLPGLAVAVIRVDLSQP